VTKCILQCPNGLVILVYWITGSQFVPFVLNLLFRLRFLVCYLACLKVPKTIEKPFVSIFLGFGGCFSYIDPSKTVTLPQKVWWKGTSTLCMFCNIAQMTLMAAVRGHLDILFL